MPTTIPYPLKPGYIFIHHESRLIPYSCYFMGGLGNIYKLDPTNPNGVELVKPEDY